MMRTITATTRRGITFRARVYEPQRPAGDVATVLYLHGATGLFDAEPMLDLLSEHRRVVAPVWPGYGDEPGEEMLEDMLDFALHGWDIAIETAASPESTSVALVGHSMGAMIAAEMACLAPALVSQLVLIDPLGVWLDAHPIPDVFAMLPFEFPGLLFADVALGTDLLSGGLDFNDPKAIERFMISNARRLGMAGKILFPVPNRRLSKRLYRLTAPTLLLWGADDRLVPTAAYAPRWSELVPHATTTVLEGAGHMVPYERPAEAAAAIVAALG